MENVKEKKKMKLWQKLTIIFSSIIVGIGVILGGAIAYFRLPVNEYYKNSEKAFIIPALSTAYVPQGFCYDADSGWFLATGYMKDGTASPIYAVDKNSGKTVKTVYLKLENGSDYTGHCGGITFWNDYVYIADGGEHCLYIFDYAQFKAAENGSDLKSIGKFMTETENGDYVKPSCVEVNGDKIVIGEFFREPKYKTFNTHKITTPNGDKNTALAVEFALDLTYTSTFGINPVPEKAYSMREQVQGMTFDGNKVYLSTSWGVSFSHIFFYDTSAASSATMTVLETEIPVYYLDRASLVKDIKAPPMSEEMAIVNGKLYVLSESASTKYIFGKFTGGKWCYATYLSKYGL